jgi:hypothetical protein
MADENVARAPHFTSVFFATVAIICFCYGAFALTLLHFVRPDYAPASNFISNYAVGRYGWIMTTWFLAMSCGLLTLVLALAKGGMRSIVGWLGLSLLFVASLGLVVSAIFPTDVPGAPSTRSGDIHDTSFLVNVGSIITATVLISAGLGGMPRMRKFRRTTWMLTGLILVAFVVQFLTFPKGMPYGLANRFFVVVLLIWLLAISMRLRRIGT